MMIFIIFWANCFAAIDLKSSFESALKQMETIKKNDELLDQAKARQKRALGTMLPTISAVGNITQIDPPPLQPNARAFLLTRQYASSFRLDQPLLRGGTISMYQFTKEDIISEMLKKDFSKISVAKEVIQVFFELAFLQDDIELLKEFKKIQSNRLNEMKERVRVGKSRQGELSLIEVQTHQVDIDLNTREQELESLKEQFSFLTGLHINDPLTLPLKPEAKINLADLENELKNRPDLLSANQEVIKADKLVSVSKGGHVPSLDLSGNYYITRTGILEQSEWDVGLRLTIPLYQGGTIDSQVKESLAQKRINLLNLSELSRGAKKDLAILYHQYSRLKEVEKSIEAAYMMAQKSFKQHEQDYKNGLVNNLELLQSLSSYIDSKRQKKRFETNLHRTYQLLMNHVGRLP